MGIFQIFFCFFLPFFCQTLPSNERERELAPMDEEKHLVLAQDMLHGDDLIVKDSSLEFQGCGKNIGTHWGNLQTLGFLREYETGFLDRIKQNSREDIALFGICPEEAQVANKGAMKELARFIAEPEGKQLVVLHLQKEDWETETNFNFQGPVQQHISPFLQHLHLLIAVFYPDTHNLTMGSKVMISGEAIPQSQVVCLSSETRYLVVRLNEKAISVEPEDLRLNTSFQVKKYSDGSTLSTTDFVWHLFGMDKRCFTKITPVIFMVLSHKGPIIRSDHTFSVSRDAQPVVLQLLKNYNSQHALMAVGCLDKMKVIVLQQLEGRRVQNKIINSKKDEFLEILSRFSALLMPSNTKPSSTIHVSLDPKDESDVEFRPQLLNVTEVEALEWLVDSHEPLVFLFLPGSKHLLANRIDERLNVTLLERITEKTQEVLEEMKDIFSTGDHVQILQKLIISCHSHFNVSYLSIDEEQSPQLGNKQHRKLHSLMLLKTLQTIHAYWQDRKKLSRQNRGAGLKPHCRLQELTINLKPYPEYKDIHFPEEININNCVGPCRFPQTTQSKYHAHVILLIQLQERRQSSLDRPPCCVPVQYQEQWLMVAHENGIRLHLYPNMVAKECGCR